MTDPALMSFGALNLRCQGGLVSRGETVTTIKCEEYFWHFTERVKYGIFVSRFPDLEVFGFYWTCAGWGLAWFRQG